MGGLFMALIAFGLWVMHDGYDSSLATSSLPKGILNLPTDASEPSDEFRAIIAKYGSPDRDDSTENDSPRPVVVTRFIEYRPENVKIAFVPVGKVTDQPPYRAWKVIGYAGINPEAKISSEEATERLKRRAKR